jgi:hypothetical protein
MSGWDDLPDGDASDDSMPDLLSDSDEDSDYEDLEDECEVASSELKRKRGRPWPASQRRKPKPLARKKTAGSHSRKVADVEKKAYTIAYFDSLPRMTPQGKKVSYKDRLTLAAVHNHVHSWNTVAKWVTQRSRLGVRAVVGRPISDFIRKIRYKGGRGKRAAGRRVFSIILFGRRVAKYPLAEEQTILWCRKQRKQGHKLTTRVARIKMFQCVKHHYGEDTGFKASAGWMKRFMGRYGLTWRRRNDNAKAGVDTLVQPLATFINELRKFRMQNPKGGDSKYGKYGVYNTFNVDQVPLPFASADPRTLEFVGTKRVWIKQPGSGLDKRQATLQLLIRPMGVQPKPTLLFRGQVKPKRACDQRKRAEEEKGYDPDVNVIWQAKAWADTVTCVEWSRTSFKEFVDGDSHIDEDEETLLLADSLRSQTKSTFTQAVKADVRGHTIFGVKNGSHLWQPVDHHVGAAYHRKMDAFYVEWMASDDGAQFAHSVPVGKRRQLMTEWAGRAYRELEAARQLAEEKQETDPYAPPAMFYAAFLRTGCLITVDGTCDDEIRPHTSIVGDLEEKFRAALLPPSAVDVSEPLVEEPFIVELDNESSSDGEVEDSEDVDDDPPESEDDDGAREPLDPDMELHVDDEGELMRAAAHAARASGQAELRDFNLARRMARQEGFAVQPQFEGVASSGNARRQQIYDEDLAKWEKEMNKKASAGVQDIIWNTAQVKAHAEANPVDEGEQEPGRRASRRQRRRRV